MSNSDNFTTDLALQQAMMTAHDYLSHAIDDIDKHLGEGYAKAHPELIAAYMKTAALDYATAIKWKIARKDWS